MIREENLKLNQSLEKANHQLTSMKSQNKEFKETNESLKGLKSQLEREKAKNKALMKRLKNDENDVIWVQKTDLNKNEIGVRKSEEMVRKREEMEGNLAGGHVTESRGHVTESRPATTTSAFSAKDPNERKIKLLNKTVKSLRADIANLQRENYNMKQVCVFYFSLSKREALGTVISLSMHYPLQERRG